MAALPNGEARLLEAHANAAGRDIYDPADFVKHYPEYHLSITKRFAEMTAASLRPASPAGLPAVAAVRYDSPPAPVATPPPSPSGATHGAAQHEQSPSQRTRGRSAAHPRFTPNGIQLTDAAGNCIRDQPPSFCENMHIAVEIEPGASVAPTTPARCTFPHAHWNALGPAEKAATVQAALASRTRRASLYPHARAPALTYVAAALLAAAATRVSAESTPTPLSAPPVWPHVDATPAVIYDGSLEPPCDELVFGMHVVDTSSSMWSQLSTVPIIAAAAHLNIQPDELPTVAACTPPPAAVSVNTSGLVVQPPTPTVFPPRIAHPPDRDYTPTMWISFGAVRTRAYLDGMGGLPLITKRLVNAIFASQAASDTARPLYARYTRSFVVVGGGTRTLAPVITLTVASDDGASSARFDFAIVDSIIDPASGVDVLLPSPQQAERLRREFWTDIALHLTSSDQASLLHGDTVMLADPLFPPAIAASSLSDTGDSPQPTPGVSPSIAPPVQPPLVPLGPVPAAPPPSSITTQFGASAMPPPRHHTTVKMPESMPFPAGVNDISLDYCKHTSLVPGSYDYVRFEALLNYVHCRWNIFASDEHLGTVNRPEARIHTTTNATWNHGSLKPWAKCTDAQRADLKRQIDEKIATGHCRIWDPASGPVCTHSIVLVPKPDGTMRLAINYQSLNDRTVPHPNPTEALPTVRAVQERSSGGTCLSTTDGRHWYHQHRLAAEDQYKTGVATPWGIVVFNVVGMGMANSGFVAQETMDTISFPFAFTSFPQPQSGGYMDDLSVATVSDPDYVHHERTLPPEASSPPPYTPSTIAAFNVLDTWWAREAGWTWSPDRAPLDQHGLPICTPADIPPGSDVDKMFFSLFVLFDRAGRLNARMALHKTEVCGHEVSILGDTVSAAGITPSFDRIQGLRDMKVPTSKDELRSALLTLQYIHTHCPAYAALAAPLLDMLSADSRCHMTPDKIAAFETLRNAVCASVTLAPLDKRYPLVLITDASKKGLGAALFTGPPNALQPFGFFSRRTTETEMSTYTTPELESMAIDWIVSKLAPHGVWRAAKVLIRVDHLNLTYYNMPAGGQTPRSPRVFKHLHTVFYVHELNATLVHIPGEHNIADSMSRLTTADEPSAGLDDALIVDAFTRGSEATTRSHVTAALDLYGSLLARRETPTVSGGAAEAADTAAIVAALSVVAPIAEAAQAPTAHPILPLGADFCKLLHSAQTAVAPPREREGPWVYKRVPRHGFDLWARKAASAEADDSEPWRLWLPPDTPGHQVRRGLWYILHTLSGHAGIAHTKRRFNDAHVSGARLEQDIAEFNRSCVDCDRFHTHAKQPSGTLHPLTPERPMQIVEIDAVGPLPETSNGHKYIFSIFDCFTKRAILSVHATCDAAAAASALAQFYAHYGMPGTVYHDGARYFTGKHNGLQVALERIGIPNLTATAYHPQSVGGVERLNQRIVEMLRKHAHHYPDVWDQHIPGIMRNINADVNRMTGVSPDAATLSFTPLQPSTAIWAATRDPNFTRVPESAQALALAVKAASLDLVAKIRNQNQRANELEKAYFDAKHAATDTFAVGDVVWRQMPAGAGASKITSVHGTIWEPYTITHRIDSSYYRARDFVMLAESKVHVSQLRKFHATHLSAADILLEARDPMVYVPERIVSHTGTTADDIVFTVKWLGYDSLSNSDEPFYGRSGPGGHYISRFGETDLAQAYLRAQGVALPVAGTAPSFVQSTSEQPTPPKRGRGRPRKLVTQDPAGAATLPPVGTPTPTPPSQDVRFAPLETAAVAPPQQAHAPHRTPHTREPAHSRHVTTRRSQLCRRQPQPVWPAAVAPRQTDSGIPYPTAPPTVIAFQQPHHI